MATAHLEAELEFVLWGAAEGLRQLDPSEPEAYRIDLPALVAQLSTFARRVSNWRVRRAALAVLATLCEVSDALGRRAEVDVHAAWEVAESCLAAGVNPWVQVQALHVQLAVDRMAGLAKARQRLHEPRDDPDDFFVRRLLLDHLISDERLREWSLIYWATEDPSPAVRQAVCHAFRVCAGAQRQELAQHMTGLSLHEEPDPKVRGYAILEYSCSLTAAEVPEIDAGLALLESVLRQEKHPLPRGVALRSISSIYAALAEREEADALLNRTRSVGWTLNGLRAQADFSAAEHEQVSATLETVWAAMDSTRWGVLRALLSALAPVRNGRSITVKFKRLPGLRAIVEADELGRLLAIASREDRDVNADIGRRGVRIWRGEQRVRRWWRVWHELRRPSFAKRKTIAHTTARRCRAAIRAPTVLMDEVTRTEVPGERLHAEAERSWGRHVPRTEDLLDLCRLFGGRARIYSAHGTTLLVAPRGVIRRTWARWRLTWRFARFANLRIVSVSAEAAADRLRFVEALRGLGAEVEFTPHPRPTGESPSVSRHVATLFGMGS